MAVKKIEFEDKVSTIESSLPAINRIRDVDCNEIKEVVNNNADELIGMNTIDDFASKVTLNETPNNYHMKAKNGVAYIDYNGQSKAHANNDLIFTLPAGYRPYGDIYTPFIQGTTNGRVWIQGANGEVRISGITSETASARVSFVISYLIRQ